LFPRDGTVRPNDGRQFKTFQEIRALLSGDLSQPIYSEEIARKLNLSVRTLHDVVRRYRGMSLHRYLAPAPAVAGAQAAARRRRQRQGRALAFGFWHLSDFSKSYRDQFGETPSQTLERGRRA
jgi:AraC family ethanolamine operon transcriptional activator